MNSLAF
jgi:hypothetical protein